MLAVGDAIVDVVSPPLSAIPSGDFQGEVEAVSLLPGGNATNFALQMAALGTRVSFVGCVGRDAFADVLRLAYREYGVDAHLVVKPRRATGATMALSWSDGSRALITALGANGSLRERHLPSALLESANHVHRAGFWWTSGLVGPPTARILARAHRAGATTSMDVSTDPRGWPASRVRAVRMCLPHVDTFFGNETEVCALADGRDFLTAAKRLCRLGTSEVVVHRGAKGATHVTTEQIVHAPGVRVRPENPTGCGDVFNAGFVRSRLDGGDVRDALRFANVCAALHLRDRAHPYPSLRAVRRLM